MTNREWLESLSDDALALWFCDDYIAEKIDPVYTKEVLRYFSGVSMVKRQCANSYLALRDWLKEEHR